MKIIATLVATALLAVGIAAPAEAFRPIPGTVFTDVCSNIEGIQTRWEFRFKQVGNSGKCKVWMKTPDGPRLVWPKAL